MFYCEDCRLQNGWNQSAHQRPIGSCEVCGTRDCHVHFDYNVGLEVRIRRGEGTLQLPGATVLPDVPELSAMEDQIQGPRSEGW